MDLLDREIQFKKRNHKVYRKVREANNCSLSYRNMYKPAKPRRVGHIILLENHNVPFGKSQRLCEHRSGPQIVTEKTTKFDNEIDLDADPTRTRVLNRNPLVEYFSRDNELPNLLSIYKKPFNDDKTERFYNENAKNLPSQLNQPFD